MRFCLKTNPKYVELVYPNKNIELKVMQVVLMSRVEKKKIDKKISNSCCIKNWKVNYFITIFFFFYENRSIISGKWDYELYKSHIVYPSTKKDACCLEKWMLNTL